MEPNSNEIFVSVIITTKNEERHISNCLQSVKDQSYPSDCIEIIVVDNASNDGTKSIAQQFTSKVFDFGPERSAQRNFGVEKAEGIFFLYLDADMILSENVIADCVNTIYESSSLVALYISEIVLGDTFLNKSRKLERSFYDATVIDGVRFINKKTFLEIGGFDENITGAEDWDLDKRLRQVGQVALITTPLYHDERGMKLKNYLSKKGYYITGFNKYIDKWGKNDPDIAKQFGFLYRYFLVFLENGKWKKIMAHPLEFSGVIFLKVLIGLKFLYWKFQPNTSLLKKSQAH